MSPTLQVTFGFDEDDDDQLDIANEPLGRAQKLHKEFSQRFLAVSGDRDAVSPIREELRSSEAFWELSEHILEIVGDGQDWISAIIRVEAKKAVRKYAGRMEEIRAERAARIAAEKAAEQEELLSMPNFGMF
ncbi:MAG: hypothetical protein Q7T25_09450 [Sideroxyarcus sp.]|nr:hypothetical protein [Sideroxyarcus sp.]